MSRSSAKNCGTTCSTNAVPLTLSATFTAALMRLYELLFETRLYN